MDEIRIHTRVNYSSKLGVYGFITLFDKLRPEIATSRNKIVKLTWEIKSHINFAMFELNKKMLKNASNILDYYSRNERILTSEQTMQELNKDELLQDNQGWGVKKMYQNKEGLDLNCRELAEYSRNNENIEFKILFWDVYQFHCQKIFGLKLKFETPNQVKYIVDNKVWDDINLEIFRPLYFIPFIDDNRLTYDNWKNINHPFSQWFIYAGKYLKQFYPAIFENILRKLGSICSHNRYVATA